MREIKFRAWDKVTVKMCPVWSIHWKAWDINPSTINFVEIELDGTIERLEHEVELMQFTGSRDKNGKGIYEGDIVKDMAGKISEIHWHDCGVYMPGFAHREIKSGPNILLTGEVEVIGNIYEHPHLLEPDNAKVES